MQIADSIINAMKLLIDNPGPENVKCVCQALKVRRNIISKLNYSL